MTPGGKTEHLARPRARGGRSGASARSLLLTVVLFGPIAGCGSDDDSAVSGAPLDCAWLASENCWKTLVSDARSCVPPADEIGVLAADGRSCTYASGASVDFRLPLALPLDSTTSAPWYFTQDSSGDECVRFDSRTQEEFTLSVQGETFVEKSHGFALQVTCPNGAHYATEDGLGLLSCPDFLSTA